MGTSVQSVVGDQGRYRAARAAKNCDTLPLTAFGRDHEEYMTYDGGSDDDDSDDDDDGGSDDDGGDGGGGGGNDGDGNGYLIGLKSFPGPAVQNKPSACSPSNHLVVIIIIVIFMMPIMMILTVITIIKTMMMMTVMITLIMTVMGTVTD